MTAVQTQVAKPHMMCGFYSNSSLFVKLRIFYQYIDLYNEPDRLQSKASLYSLLQNDILQHITLCYIFDSTLTSDAVFTLS